MKYALDHRETGNNAEWLVENQFERFVTDWALNDPAKAAEWTKSLPESPERLEAQLKVAAMWNRYAPDEAREWAKTLESESRSEVMKVLE